MEKNKNDKDMKKLITLLIIILILPFFIKAQDKMDALRYSTFELHGTARSASMGNAFGALGGDFTSVSINPAGLGIYRSDELTFSPDFGQIKVNTNYMGNNMSDSKYNIAINNLSYVTSLSSWNKNETGLINVNIGLGLTRLKNFNKNSIAGADNMDRSMMDYFTDNANSGKYSDFYEDLAGKTYMLWYDEEEDIHWNDIEQNGYGQSQRKSISTQGYMNEYSIAAGFNFNHKFYVGASVGIIDLYYKESSELLEWDSQNKMEFFNSMQFNTKLRTSGTGYNGKIGVIYKPINSIRLGVSLHTPTFFNLQDTFETSMFSEVADENEQMRNNEAISPFNEYDYDLETPLRTTFSAAYIFGKRGLISVDYELVDHSSTKLRRGGDGYNFTDENKDISEAYKTIGNLRLGAEFVATTNISLRAGYENYPSQYKSVAFNNKQPNSGSERNVYSAGIGYKTKKFFIDLAYKNSVYKTYKMLYPAPDSPNSDIYNTPEMASFESIKNNIIFTLGFKF